MRSTLWRMPTLSLRELLAAQPTSGLLVVLILPDLSAPKALRFYDAPRRSWTDGRATRATMANAIASERCSWGR